MSSSNGTQVTNTRKVTCGIINPSTGAWIGPPTTQTRIDYDNWDYPSPRKRPDPLRPTAGYYLRQRWNPGMYVGPYNSTAALYGDALYALGGAGGSKTLSSQPDALAAMISANAKFGSGPFNLATFVGEFRESAEMVSKRARQISEAAKQLKNGNYEQFAQVLGIPGLSRRARARANASSYDKRLANHWLEYTYGWSPLVSDVYGAIQALHKGVTGAGTEVTATVGRGQSVDDFTHGANVDNFNLFNQGSKSLGYKASITGTVTNPNARTLNELGLLNPLALAWELMPYSFVVDWFLPVGDVLASLTSEVGMSNVFRTISYNEMTWSYTRVRPEVAYQTTKRHYRTAPPPTIVLPLLLGLQSASIGWQRATSAVSLLRQRFR